MGWEKEWRLVECRKLFFWELEAEGDFALAVEDATLLVLLNDLIWVVDTGKLVHLVFQS